MLMMMMIIMTMMMMLTMMYYGSILKNYHDCRDYGSMTCGRTTILLLQIVVLDFVG